ncbi:protein ACCELERATED CELL DEATH 6-like [Senna tora]|uniref:Protein ACCELERATED CELL DEATH 6-like n=1 Tax=Senna tora TaxID=362788 RepID=A0A834TLF0_9FABA|nr:protein ACCELERATED CELL DEATH 6-like [Senna tora]
MNNHPQQQNQEQTIRKWHLVEVGNGRSRYVLEMKEKSPTPIHLITGDDPSEFSCDPMLSADSAPVPIIKVKFESTEGGQVLKTEFESLYEKKIIIHQDKKEEKKEEEIGYLRVPYYGLITDLEMQKLRSELTHGTSKYGRHEISKEQQHEESKNLESLRDAYRLMNANVCGSNWNEIAIYKQRSPLGNTVLHLAASYGNNGIIGKVAEYAPRLFITRNSNYDTALHVAARTGHASTIQMLLNAYFPIATCDANYDYGKFLMDKSVLDLVVMLSLTLLRNNQGNTFFQEAFMVNSRNGAIIFQAFEAPFIVGNAQFEAQYKAALYQLALFALNNEEKSLLYLAIEVGCKEVVIRLMDICVLFELEPRGKSPLLPPIINRDKDMLELILSKKPNWVHLKDEEGRFPLHYAAYEGYLKGVSFLIEKCASCTMECDNKGFYPIHLAAAGGYVEVVDELLKWCPDPAEMVDKKGRNFLHIAAGTGKYKVVSYILQHPKLEKMINQKDEKGNSPLHVATRNWIMYSSRTRNLVVGSFPCSAQFGNPYDTRRLTWSALHYAGAPRNSVKVPPSEQRAWYPEQNKDRVDSLIVVSTLIITASFAAGFTVPGNVEQGKAVLLNHHMFQLFIFAITVSTYGSISTTIILIWARLGDLHLTLLALKYALPLLGITLCSLSLAFLAAVYLVVSKLSWLASTFLLVGVLLILMLLLLYVLLCLSSSSTFPILRWISYYYFLVLLKLADAETDGNHKGSNSSSSSSCT